LVDSLPQSVLEPIEFERRDLVETAEQQKRELTAVEQGRLDELSPERIEQYLDSGQGLCYLAQPEIADLVAGALQHFDGVRYQLLAWCVMPNHVHVVFQPAPEYELPGILHSWKSFTAKHANKVLKKGGEFWQREYYDHLARDEQDLDRIVRYVMENPARAGLKDWKWVWCSPGLRPAG
jgi:REP element-mobilizing transposase RayT